MTKGRRANEADSDVHRSVALLATQVCTGLASAKVFAPHAYNGTYPAGSFTGADVVGKEAPFGLTLRKVAVDQSTRNIYVGEEGGGFGSEPGFLYKLDSAGASQPFSALAPNTVIGGISPTAPERPESTTQEVPPRAGYISGLRVTPSRASYRRGKKWALETATPSSP